MALVITVYLKAGRCSILIINGPSAYRVKVKKKITFLSHHKLVNLINLINMYIYGFAYKESQVNTVLLSQMALIDTYMVGNKFSKNVIWCFEIF